MAQQQSFILYPGLSLEKGGYLPSPTITYHTYGQPGKPVIWVCHALTANSDVFDWWAGLFGPQDPFNPNDYYIVCANVLASCYGTSGPLSENSDTGQVYYHDFPEVTIRDMAAAHEAAAKCLESGKKEEICLKELQTACKGLAIGKHCGMKHQH